MPDRARPVTLSLILPVLDEVEPLATLVPRLLADVQALTELIVVDDGSTDGTRELVREVARRDTRVKLVERAGEPSLASSLRDGVGLATADLVGWMDADGTMAVEDLLRLVACVEGGAAVAVGTRFAPGGGIKGDDGTGALRALFALGRSRDAVLPVVLSWALNTIVVPAILRDGVHDYTSGFIVGRRSILGALELRGRHGEYFVDLFARMRSLGHDVAEVPYRARPRTRGRSKTVARPSDYLVRGRAYLGAAWSARSVR